MDYVGNIIRPPSEANSIILQVTIGCSHNKCTFCGAYKDVLFRLKDKDTITRDILFASRYCRRQHNLFIADGDALILPQQRLVDLFCEIREKIPHVHRIRLYGNAKSILRKSLDQLKELKALGLDRIYMGLESGSDQVLAQIRKGADSARMIEAGKLVREAGLFLSVTILLGVGGRSLSKVHSRETATVLSRIKANQIAALTLMIIPGTPLHNDLINGRFTPLDEREILDELREIVSGVRAEKVQIQANHASNYLPISGRLPRDRQKIIDQIDLALAGVTPLAPENMRRL